MCVPRDSSRTPGNPPGVPGNPLGLTPSFIISDLGLKTPLYQFLSNIMGWALKSDIMGVKPRDGGGLNLLCMLSVYHSIPSGTVFLPPRINQIPEEPAPQPVIALVLF